MKALNKVLMTQFLSALADNMILMATIYIIAVKQLGDFYVGIVQACFFIAYVLLAPYSGILSEKVAKSTVLRIGNVFKLIGTLFLLIGLDPAVSYAIVGVGACVYSPGKYAILKEITFKEEELYKANGLIEGSTIVAILIGTVLGGFLSVRSINLTMTIILACYLLSLLFALSLAKGKVSNVTFKEAWLNFGKDINLLFSIKEAKISIIGSSSFWMTSAVLRLSALAWIPVALNIGQDKASLYMGATALGIMSGAVCSPKIIPLTKLNRLTYVGYGMAFSIAIMGWFPNIVIIGVLLYLAGFLGGTYMIPLNTILQQKGTIVGNGKTIAIQNFFENLLMVLGTLVYSGALRIGLTIPIILLGFGIIFSIIVSFVKRGIESGL